MTTQAARPPPRVHLDPLPPGHVATAMQTVRELGEVGLIARLARRIMRPRAVHVGIGDDTAVLRPPRGRWWLFGSDMLIEDVHFRRRETPAGWIGWKALACAISDIAAMGGRPHWAVVSLGLSPTTSVGVVETLYAGLQRCARRFGVAIVGGDTVRAPQLVIDVAILGTVHPSHLTLRSGARVGDLVFVTGRLGGSYASGRHATFTPRLREAQSLVRRVRIHAMMDLSDGLASDLWQMARASRVTLRVEASRLPISRAGRTVHHALMDGEDFELLFAVTPREAARVPRRIGSCPVTPIGSVVARGAGVELVQLNGRTTPVVPHGFTHF